MAALDGAPDHHHGFSGQLAGGTIGGGLPDSHTYDTRFMLRLDEISQAKLQQLMQQFGTSIANIICQLMLQATPEDFPTSWHMRTAERRAPQAPRDHIGKEWKSKP
jgi:hypothetical protein